MLTESAHNANPLALPYQVRLRTEALRRTGAGQALLHEEKGYSSF
jgi:hypothetical protein